MSKLLLAVLVLLSATALAQGVEASAPPPAPAPSFEISLKAGAHFPQIANPLTTSFDGVLKVGYGLPFLERRLQVFLDLAYTQPSVKVTGADARVPGGSFTATTTLRDLSTSLGLCFFILEPSRALVPYVSAGARVHFLRAETNGSAGSSTFGAWQETDTRFGGVFAAGAGYRVGPGRIMAEVTFNVLPVDQRLTGASNASSLSVMLGYGLFF